MPTYEYECQKCERTYEVQQRIIEKPIEQCQTSGCEGKPKRLIAGSTSFVLNGKGWFKDGY